MKWKEEDMMGNRKRGEKKENGREERKWEVKYKREIYIWTRTSKEIHINVWRSINMEV